MPTIAFVAPWYGDIPGGMETLTRQTAERLTARGWPIEIITTCIADFYADWGRNHHKPGLDDSGGSGLPRHSEAAGFGRSFFVNPPMSEDGSWPDVAV
jgi:hypothetical protein